MTPVKEAMGEAGGRELPFLEKYLQLLSTIAHICPLLGILGTVSGMIELFSDIQSQAGVIGPGELAGGIWEALITTAAGLAVAIPSLLAHNYFVSRVDGFLTDVEQASMELSTLLTAKGGYEG